MQQYASCYLSRQVEAGERQPIVLLQVSPLRHCESNLMNGRTCHGLVPCKHKG